MNLKNIFIYKDLIKFPGTAIHINNEYSIIKLLLGEELVDKSKKDEYIVVNNVNFYGLKGKCILFFKNQLLNKIKIQLDKKLYNPYIKMEDLVKQVSKENNTQLSSETKLKNKNFYLFDSLVIITHEEETMYSVIIKQR